MPSKMSVENIKPVTDETPRTISPGKMSALRKSKPILLAFASPRLTDQPIGRHLGLGSFCVRKSLPVLCPCSQSHRPKPPVLLKLLPFTTRKKNTTLQTEKNKTISSFPEKIVNLHKIIKNA